MKIPRWWGRRSGAETTEAGQTKFRRGSGLAEIHAPRISSRAQHLQLATTVRSTATLWKTILGTTCLLVPFGGPISASSIHHSFNCLPYAHSLPFPMEIEKPATGASSTAHRDHPSLPPLQPIYILRGHTAAIHAVRFFRANTRLVTADADGWVIIWGVTTKRPIAVWKAHSSALLGVSPWGEHRLITYVRAFITTSCMSIPVPYLAYAPPGPTFPLPRSLAAIICSFVSSRGTVNRNMQKADR